MLENTIISCVLGSNLDGVQIVIKQRPTTKGHFGQCNFECSDLVAGLKA